MNKRILIVNHTLQDKIFCSPVLNILLTEYSLLLKNIDYKGTEHSVSMLSAQLHLLKMLEEKEHQYLLLWLYCENIGELMPEMINHFLTDYLSKNKKKLTFNHLLNTYLYRNGLKVIISDDLKEIPIFTDLIELTNNAIKYAKSFIKFYIKENKVFCENDIGKQNSGTRQGLTLHDITLEFKDNIAISFITIPKNFIFITINEIKELLISNGYEGIVNEISVTHVQHLIEHYFEFESIENKNKAWNFIIKILSKENLDEYVPKCIWVSKDLYFDTINISLDFNYFSGYTSEIVEF